MINERMIVWQCPHELKPTSETVIEIKFSDKMNNGSVWRRVY